VPGKVPGQGHETRGAALPVWDEPDTVPLVAGALPEPPLPVAAPVIQVQVAGSDDLEEPAAVAAEVALESVLEGAA
jgi:hypothetical protein